MSRMFNLSNNLLSLIKKREWCKIPQYLYQAKLPDKNNTYALHEVCCDPEIPLKIVKDIYYAYPEAALVQDANNDTPMSNAVGAVFEDAVHFLANVCPTSSSIGDIDGFIPIQLAVSFLRRHNMIESIIKTNPEAAFVLDEDESAFDCFFGHWNMFMRIVLHINQILNREVLDRFIGYGDWKILDIYQNTCLFLKAADIYRRSIIIDDNHLLHCALREESCHWAFCVMMMRLYPEQLLNKDSNGDLPIHVILTSTESSDEDTFSCFDCCTEQSKFLGIEYANGESKYCCEDCLESTLDMPIRNLFEIRPVKKVHEIVPEMIAIAPETVFISDRRGMYPLHVAIQNQKSYDITRQIYRAFPDLGKTQDKNTKLLPFMLAAVGEWESKECQLSIIYYLLREDPTLVFGV